MGDDKKTRAYHDVPTRPSHLPPPLPEQGKLDLHAAPLPELTFPGLEALVADLEGPPPSR